MLFPTAFKRFTDCLRHDGSNFYWLDFHHQQLTFTQVATLNFFFRNSDDIAVSDLAEFLGDHFIRCSLRYTVYTNYTVRSRVVRRHQWVSLRTGDFSVLVLIRLPHAGDGRSPRPLRSDSLRPCQSHWEIWHGRSGQGLRDSGILE